MQGSAEKHFGIQMTLTGICAANQYYAAVAQRERIHLTTTDWDSDVLYSLGILVAIILTTRASRARRGAGLSGSDSVTI